MSLKNILIIVDDIDESINVYENSGMQTYKKVFENPTIMCYERLEKLNVVPANFDGYEIFGKSLVVESSDFEGKMISLQTFYKEMAIKENFFDWSNKIISTLKLGIDYRIEVVFENENYKRLEYFLTMDVFEKLCLSIDSAISKKILEDVKKME